MVQGKRTALEQFEDEARRRGWRILWTCSTWKSFGCPIVALDIFKGAIRIGGGSEAFLGSTPANFSGETLASMILDALPSRGAEQDEPMAA